MDAVGQLGRGRGEGCLTCAREGGKRGAGSKGPTLPCPAPGLYLATCPPPPRMHFLGLIIAMANLRPEEQGAVLCSLPPRVSREVPGERAVPPPGSQLLLPWAGIITSCPAFDPYHSREPVGVGVGVGGKVGEE